jgi:hypothetical protein
MVSDNATTYLAAAQEIKKLMNSEEIQKFMANHRVQWKFIPKRAPWYGGFWERLIGLTKTAIKKVLGRARITLEELTTLVTEVEAMLNDRPLTYVNDCDPLTPSLLLHGRLLNTLPYESVDDEELTDPTFATADRSSLEKRTMRLANIHENFWKRWSTEYLTALRERHNPNGKTENTIKVGDVVTVHSDDKRRVNWNLAIVLKLIYSNDGLVRSATIKTKGGETNRPISKQYPLEITCDDVENVAHTADATADGANDEQPAKGARRPTRLAALKARVKINNWANLLKD